MLTQKLAVSYFSRMALQFVQMITGFIVARIVGPDVLGILAYGLAFVSMFTFIADLGTGTAYIKLYASGYDKIRCFGTYVRIRIALVAVFTLVVTFSYFSKRGFNFDFRTFSAQDYVVVIYLLITIIGLLYTAFTSTWMARTEQAKTDIPQLAQTLLFQIFRLVVALLGFKAIAIASSNLIAVIIVAPLYFYLGRDLQIGTFDKSIALKMMKISLPVILLIVFQTLFYSTDKVLLKHFSSTTELGYYSAAFVFATFIRTIEGSAGLLFFPFFSKAISENNYTLINNSIKKFEKFSFAFILPGALIISIMADKIILLSYGGRFLPAADILRVMVPTFFISLVILPYGNIIAGKGLFYLAAFCWGASFLFFGAFAYLFVGHVIENQKGQGMALALLLGTIVLAAFYYFYSKRNLPELKILPAKKGLIFTIAISTLMFFPYQYWVKDAGTAVNIFYVVIFSGLYLSFGYLLKIVGKDEYALLASVINLKKMKHYISSELMNKKDENNPSL
jgi:O-antigen/teichoic acid export membrane protein